MGANTLELADGPESCAELLLALSRGADSTRKARRRFVETFVRPRGMGTSVAAHAIELAADRLPGNVIDERLAKVANDDALSEAAVRQHAPA